MLDSRAMKALAALLLLLTTPALAQEIPASEYKARRERVAKAIGANAMFVLTSPEPAQRNGDVTYPFRQDDHLLYLTGITQPNTSLVLIPSEEQYREILFVDEANPAREGDQGGVRGAPSCSSSVAGFISGNHTTSRRFGASVSRATKRSMPMPQPEIGGMPNSIAVR